MIGRRGKTEMRINIITFGSMGDIQPYIALGLGFKSAGLHSIRIVTHTSYEQMVRSRELDFVGVEGDPSSLLETDQGHDWLETGDNPLQFVRGLRRVVEPIMSRILAQCWQACQDSEVIIVSPLGLYAGYHIAEKLKVPLFVAPYLPMHPTKAFPHPLTQIGSPSNGMLNLFTYFLAGTFSWQSLLPTLNRMRRQILDLPPLPFWAMYREIFKQQLPVLYGYSPTILPKPPEWGDNIHITGYWFLDRPFGWQPSAELVRFLSAGPPPVYVGFGSMNNRDPKETTELILNALAMTKQRGVLSAGWGGLRNTDLPDEVLMIESIPHDWLFPQMSVLVHHGGAGTTASGLRAGIPTVVIPFFADQPFWGWRVDTLSAGPRPIPRSQLTVERLTDAIRIALNDQNMKRRANLLGQCIRSEDGVTRAIEAFQKLFMKL
jgi:sterol 3beta-glucosyltransferase